MTDSSATSGIAEQLQSLRPQLEDLIASPEPMSDVLGRFAEVLQSAVAGAGSAVWLVDGQRSLGLLTDHGVTDCGLLDEIPVNRLNQQLLIDGLRSGDPVVYPFNVENGLDAEAVLMIPIRQGQDRVGIVQLFGSAERLQITESVDREAIGEVALLLERYFTRLTMSSAVHDPSRFLTDFTQLTRCLHDSLDPRRVAMTAANELRMMFDSDRVSIVERVGNRLVLSAVSGQKKLNPRANQSRHLSELTAQLLRTGKRFVYTGDSEDLAPQVLRPLAEYVRESGTRMLLVEPLLPPVEDQTITDPEQPKRRPPKPFGAVLFEQFEESQPTPALNRHAETVVPQVALAVRNAARHERLLGIPGLRTFGHTLSWFRGRRLATALSLLLFTIVSITLTCVITTPYQVEAQGQLMPRDQRRVFAAVDGEVAEVHVTTGQQVRTGQQLLTMVNPKLEGDLLRAEGRRSEIKQALAALIVERNRRSADTTREQSLRLQAQIEQQQIDLRATQKQLELLQQQTRALQVVAPQDGTVTTAELPSRLLGRPVRRGERLIELMDESRDWQLEVDVAEHRTGHVIDALSEEEARPVEFRMVGQPAVLCSGTLTHIDTTNDGQSTSDRTLRAYVSVNPEELPLVRIGADVTVKIVCEERSWAYYYFGETWEFLQRQWWL